MRYIGRERKIEIVIAKWTKKEKKVFNNSNCRHTNREEDKTTR